jgi:hypothetical protein
VEAGLNLVLVPLPRWVRVRIMGKLMRGISQPPSWISQAAG